jgi:uncharacterized membrane protein
MQEKTISLGKVGIRLPFRFRNVWASPGNAFLTLGLVFGLLFMIAIPPFQVPDEPGHLYRAYQLSEGVLIAPRKDSDEIAGAWIPQSFVRLHDIWAVRIPFRPSEKVKGEQFTQTFDLSLNKEEAVFVKLISSIYSPIPYIPQITGVAIAKILNLPAVWSLYLGRLANLIATTLIVFLAIRVLPVYRWVFALLALTPMALAQRASLSADATLNSIACLAVAVVINLACSLRKDQVSKRDLLIMGGLGVAIALSKQAYFLISYLCLLIPQEKFRDRKQYWVSCSLIILAAMLSWFLWSLIIKTHVGIPLHAAVGASVERQTQFLLSHPFTLFSTAWNCLQEVERTLREFIGVLGWLDTPIPAIVAVSYPHILVLVALISGQPDFLITGTQKLKIFLVLAGTVFLLYLSQYLIWTSVGASTVLGIQGRYFIPVAPLFFLLFYNHRFSFKIPEKTLNSCLFVYLLVALTASWISILDRYY